MAKKAKPKTPPRHTLHFRVKEEDQEDFRFAAESEGFNSVTAWVLYHLRNQAKQAKQSQVDDKKD